MDSPDRNFNHLHPEMARRLLVFLDACGRRKVAAFMSEGWRSGERQEWLWKSGRGREGPILTYARSGHSYHNLLSGGKPYSAAADIAVWDEDVPWSKTLEWEGTEKEWKVVQAAAKEAGLQTLEFEKPHLQLPYPLKDLQATR